MKTYKILLIISLCFLNITGCSSKQAKCKIVQRHITIITEPEGANVLQLNLIGQPSTKLGVTPILNQPVVVVTDIIKMKNMPASTSLDMLKRAGGNVKVLINKDGYQQYTGYLNTKPNETVSHQITLKPIENP